MTADCCHQWICCSHLCWQVSLINNAKWEITQLRKRQYDLIVPWQNCYCIFIFIQKKTKSWSHLLLLLSSHVQSDGLFAQVGREMSRCFLLLHGGGEWSFVCVALCSKIKQKFTETVPVSKCPNAVQPGQLCVQEKILIPILNDHSEKLLLFTSPVVWSLLPIKKNLLCHLQLYENNAVKLVVCI